MNNTLDKLFEIVKERKGERIEGSYTCYLFDKGMDKILKKCGEECTEMVIAAKNGDIQEIVNEACDLIYHLLVLLAEKDITLEKIYEELEKRAEKQKNLKKPHKSDKNT